MVIVQDGQRRFELHGVGAAIVRALVQARDELNTHTEKHLKVEFNCAGKTVQMRPIIYMDEVTIKVE